MKLNSGEKQMLDTVVMNISTHLPAVPGLTMEKRILLRGLADLNRSEKNYGEVQALVKKLWVIYAGSILGEVLGKLETFIESRKNLSDLVEAHNVWLEKLTARENKTGYNIT